MSAVLEPGLFRLEANLDVPKLIWMVKMRQPLWDRKHQHYHDRIRTMKMWADVATALGSDTDTVRAKWKGLRDTFRGELKKINKAIAKGKPCDSTQWEYFKQMEFVKDQMYSTRRSFAEIGPTNASVKEELTDNITLADFCKTEVVEEEPAPKHIKTENGSSLNGDNSPCLSPARGCQAEDEESTNPQVPDDDYSFLMSILPQLRSLPTVRNLYVRLKIQELLYQEILALEGNES